MPKSREEIKHDPVSSEVWRNNRTAVMWFDPRKILPLGDHILVELHEEQALSQAIVTPDIAKNQEIGTRIGTVIAVGPGKLREIYKTNFSWEMPKIVRTPMTLKPGDRVVIGHYSDWESWNCSADGHETKDRNIVLCQEADVRFVIHDNGRSH